MNNVIIFRRKPRKWLSLTTLIIIFIGILGCNSKVNKNPPERNLHKNECDISPIQNLFMNGNIYEFEKDLDPSTKEYFQSNFPDSIPKFKNKYKVTLLKESVHDSTCSFKINNITLEIYKSKNGLIILSEEMFDGLFFSEAEICYNIGLYHINNDDFKKARKWIMWAIREGYAPANKLLREHPQIL